MSSLTHVKTKMMFQIRKGIRVGQQSGNFMLGCLQGQGYVHNVRRCKSCHAKKDSSNQLIFQGENELQLLKVEVLQLKKQLNNVTNILQTMMTVPQFVELLQSQSQVENLTFQVDKKQTTKQTTQKYCNDCGVQISRYSTVEKPKKVHNFSVQLNKPLQISHVTVYNPSGSSEWSSLRIQGAQQLTIEHCTFNGIGLDIDIKSKVTLNKVDFLNTGGAGLSVGNSTKCDINEVSIGNCKGDGCKLTNCKGVQLNNMKINGCNGVGLLSKASLFHIQNSFIDSCEYGITLSGEGKMNSHGTYDKDVVITRVTYSPSRDLGRS
eukprot:TRINITY_DN3861_c0_g2_i7.p1 TRINITY_DN3861_c0_g2~~TRINITY_DN3861_c0_g2_i7.p1  ORF type:complete len:321 (+),score=3.45 TRINITY_DN3861_c0_g2_i7:266-1228(+)